jgi:alcohol dehydrogenase (cytochrome c)
MRTLQVLVLATATASGSFSQVNTERLLNAENEPSQWMTYSGTYKSQRFSKLAQINRQNVTQLELKWVFQAESLDKFQSTPLVVDGVMYLTEPPNNVVAIDAATGRRFWKYTHNEPTKVNVCCGRVNRGLAIWENSLFMGTVDGRLLSLDAKTGSVNWDITVVDYLGGYSITLAPLVVKDKIIIGTAGGEYGIRGFLQAHDAKTGKKLWRFYTIPGPGEPGHETWEGDSWKRGGGSVWLTGSYDPELNLTYWGIGNPSPDWNGDVRKGDNLYSDSVVALNPDNGELNWYYQFTPHDEWDWDAVQVPVLVDRPFKGKQRKLILWGNRNGFYYTLDRVTGEFLVAKAFVYQNWAKGIDKKGRPIRAPGQGPSVGGTKTYPSVQGATNWYSPTYSPQTGLFYLSVWESYPSTYYKGDPTYTRGNRYVGSLPQGIYPNTTTDAEPGYGAVRALDPETGELEWEFKMAEVSESGLMSTAGNILFSGSMQGQFVVLDVFNGDLLWSMNLGGRMTNSPITYQVADSQFVAVSAGHSLFVFGLKD